MFDNNIDPDERFIATQSLKSFIRGLGVDLVGVADLYGLEGMPTGIPATSAGFLNNFHYAIVLGAQLNKLGKKATGSDVSHFMEKVAIDVLTYLEEKGFPGLIVHTEDEFDPRQRMGLLSLKVLAKAAGLGWQGRSLLIISPEYGPVHRWIAILTDMDLQADEAVPNQCGDCSLCIDRCPKSALTLVPFNDHPENRSDVLDIHACLGDIGCKICLIACPWVKTENVYHN